MRAPLATSFSSRLVTLARSSIVRASLVAASLVATSLLAASLGVGSLVPVAHAQAGQRVVVERFRGPRASHLREMLVEDLEGAGYTIVGEDELDRAARDLDVGRSPSDEDYVALARQLRASAFVSGTVSRARRSWRLSVRVRNGADGAILGSEGWGGRTQGAMDGVGRSGADRLREHLEAARAPGAASPAQASDGETPWYQREREEPPPEEIEEEVRAEPAPSSSRFDSFRLSLSGGSVWRSMQAIATVYAVRRMQPAPDPATTLYDEERGYTSRGIGHAELGIEAELYPGALGDQPFPYLGVLVSFRHSVGLSSTACRRTAAECTGDGRIDVGTEQMDISAGVRGRYRFGNRRGDFEIMLEALWGMSTFTLDTAALQQIDLPSIIPPMEYQYVALGAGFQVSPVPDAFTIAARADWRPGVQIGPKTREVWGIDTGPASGFLVGLELRHDATWLAEGAFVALRAEYFQLVTEFEGQVGCAAPSGCPTLPPDQQYMDDNLWEPWPVDASGRVVGGIADPVTDHYVRWGLYIGYAFR